MGKLKLLAAGIVILSFITAAYFAPSLPGRVAVHWNFEGTADGYADSGFGAYFVPFLMLGMLVLFHFLPMLDPMKKNYAAFRKEYDGMIAVLIGFMYYVYALTLAINLGYALNIVQFLSPAFAGLFFYMGMLLAKAKQNWFVGIRTPWTMSSERVWKKTHEMASKMFKAAGVVSLLGIFYPKAGLAASVAMAVAIAIFTFIYSYVEFRKGKKR